eukprot:CAMPEP_0198209532 /NCGR_PEP_ID=MMETSP1445-20131203/16736_1 /TAXON_ID=36898 /ORGANISM="Pyramimonas sp., Strain CCMP2087" /LENGTH=220 /DNA_ID=CAMNT_0043883343 /DNA_START=62 /DNA_END=724 /DNA_ORIENTATION=+
MAAITASSTVLRSVSATKGLRSVRTQAVARKAFVVKAEQDSVAYCKTLPGICAPFSDMFDPAGLLKTATVEDVRRYREAELTHGRVAMLASLGFVVGEQLEDFPLFDGAVTGPAINQFQQVQSGFWVPLVIAIGVCEAYRVSVGWARPDSSGVNKLLPEYEMGDLGFDPLGLAPTDPAELKEKKTRELNNGRLAMIAIAGFVTQEFVNNTEIFQHLLKNN